jgi:hypothetical protein
MAVFLSFGKDSEDNYQHINDQVSGKGSLFCPFCKCPLIAIRGSKKAAHFRHDGETCNESLNEIPQIEGWHHFHLNYDVEIVEMLEKGYRATAKSPNTFQEWNQSVTATLANSFYKLIEIDNFRGSYTFSRNARVVLGSMTLVKFSDWMRKTLSSRAGKLIYETNQKLKHKAWFEIEAHRQQAILNATLYFMEFSLENGSRIHKVGRTQRDAALRLSETRYDLERATNQKVIDAKVLREVEQSGHIEKYVFHRYSAYKADDIGNHTEYLDLDDKTVRKLKAEFTKISNNIQPFTKEERFITTGRWRYEEKRLDASRRGIALTKRDEGKFGRPKGTALDTQEFIAKHNDIVRLIGINSLSEIAARTGKSRSTVKRVKAALESNNPV